MTQRLVLPFTLKWLYKHISGLSKTTAKHVILPNVSCGNCAKTVADRINSLFETRSSSSVCSSSPEKAHTHTIWKYHVWFTHMQYYKATSILLKFPSSHFPSSLFLLHKYCCSEPQWNRHLYARPHLLSDHCSKHTWGCDSMKIFQNRMQHSRILRFFRLSLQHKSPTSHTSLRIFCHLFRSI